MRRVGRGKDDYPIDEAQIWDAVTGRPIREIDQGKMQFTQNSRLLALEKTGDGLNVVYLVAPVSQDRVEMFRFPGSHILNVGLGPNNSSFWMRQNGTGVLQWNLETQKPIGPVLSKASPDPFSVSVRWNRRQVESVGCGVVPQRGIGLRFRDGRRLTRPVRFQEKWHSFALETIIV